MEYRNERAVIPCSLSICQEVICRDFEVLQLEKVIKYFGALENELYTFPLRSTPQPATLPSRDLRIPTRYMSHPPSRMVLLSLASNEHLSCSPLIDCR